MKRYEVVILNNFVQVYDNHLCKEYIGYFEDGVLHAMFPSTFENIVKALKQEGIEL